MRAELGNERSVLFVGNFISAREYGCVCAVMADGLSKAGWKVMRTSYERAPLPRLWDMLSTTWRRRRDYRIAHLDVFSGRGFLWAELVCALLRLTGKPYVLTLRGGSLPEFLKRCPRRGRRVLQSAIAVTAPSRFLQQKVAPYRADIIMIPNPIDLPRYPFRLRERPAPRLVWLRAFERLYNPKLAVRVLARLRRSFPKASLLMIGRDKGDGSLSAVRRLVSESGLSSAVDIVPGVPKDQVPGWLHQGDIFLNTTNVDNMPVSVVEAMACGLCIVSTNAGGLPYLLSDGEDALLVPPRDEAAFDAAIRRILIEPGLAGKLSANARRAAAASDWQSLLPRWEKLLNTSSVPCQASGDSINEPAH